ncbi:hypothetical protein UVI_02024460 [Ustilaginoidea virens]|uniref:DUF8004 domain-containing protein n=1 Tax=Ustilaginoidea virens TaxID=1159556 RepID=A0A063C4Q4_USTVR|nr:hypothetical protein UVI_02024460 [Ustilaginoidea virens]
MSLQDPELWTRNGNCLIYIGGRKDGCRQRQAKQPPAFRVPFEHLLNGKCYPLIEKSQVNWPEGSEPARPCGPSEIDAWHRANPTRTVELFITAPQVAEKQQLRRHQLLIRNFIAWIMRKSLVGETLGEALVGLLHCMQEYRTHDHVDNVADLVHYLNREGYLSFAGQAEYALAVLRLAETFCLKDLYFQALAHCVGMKEMLPSKREFQFVSFATRKLIDDAESELNSRLRRTWDMLRSFLDQELSEAHIGIPAGLRAHLERFRSFLLSFYSAKLGYWPPRAFDGSVCRVLKRDFLALYNLLVDQGYNSNEAMPFVAVGGICTLQLIQTFDTNNGFEPMPHPLPKLPQQSELRRSRRILWIPRGSRQRGEEHQLNRVSLVNASNWREDSFQNGLVRAYRKFEEDCAISPKKIDRNERVSLVDGRKIRWILIYAVHQTLQCATQRPVEMQDDPEAEYVVSIAKNTRTPWQDGKLHAGLSQITAKSALKHHLERTEMEQSPSISEKLEIKPDIDYFALTHKTDESPKPTGRQASLPDSTDASVSLSRTSSFSSFKQALSRSSTIRRSTRRLKLSVPASNTSTAVTSMPLYHEIVVPRYGNGASDVQLEPTADAPAAKPAVQVSRSASTASETGSSNISTFASSVSTGSTLDSSLNSPTQLPESPLHKLPGKARRWSNQDCAYPIGSSSCPNVTTCISKRNSLKRRPISTTLEGCNYAARAFGQFVDQERRAMFASSRPVGSDPKRGGNTSHSRSMPLPIQEDEIKEEPGGLIRDSGDWTAMQAFLDGKLSGGGSSSRDAWEQYADLGGLTEAR